MSGPSQMGGLIFRLGQYHIRFWKHGFEYGNRLGGRVHFWPWSPVAKRIKAEGKKHER